MRITLKEVVTLRYICSTYMLKWRGKALAKAATSLCLEGVLVMMMKTATSLCLDAGRGGNDDVSSHGSLSGRGSDSVIEIEHSSQEIAAGRRALSCQRVCLHFLDNGASVSASAYTSSITSKYERARSYVLDNEQV